LVNDVLDIARIESGRESLSPEAVSVGATVEECFRLVAPAAAESGTRIDVRLGGLERAFVSADRQRLLQALLNLMSNAVKYAGGGATVTVAAVRNGNGTIRMSVCDDGPGLSPEQQARLFQPFDRLGAERTATPGTGLGLALAKKLVEVMGGDIGVRTAPGEGAEFWIELPVAAAPALPRPLVPHPAQVAPHSGEGRTVLYVEDNLATVDLMEDVFALRPQIRLITAMQGSLALELAREHHPDLVILDLHLPDMDGDQVLRALRASPETAGIPVVVFSADATERQVSRLLADGARKYLFKPAKVPEFLAVLDEVLSAPAGVPS
ncbi:MAG: response regulator, partial [Chloroflexi bacterium]|nr:response regulator [Chloroflexota bacterium]